MKGSLFCGLRNRTTEGGRPGKPRNTKENRHMEGFSTDSKQREELRSSLNVNQIVYVRSQRILIPEALASGIFQTNLKSFHTYAGSLGNR